MKKTQRIKLSFDRETLRVLARNDLGKVAGGYYKDSQKDCGTDTCPPMSESCYTTF